ncbi:MAG: hypothetical protein EON58_05540 [Alphaproteobacteria bacterium]|nr:MAG: hypothetical protein EON58_05540 [Alphaproteobacteria bacterium]
MDSSDVGNGGSAESGEDLGASFLPSPETNPPSEVMAKCRDAEAELLRTISWIAKHPMARVRFLASYHLVYGLIDEASMLGVVEAIEAAEAIFFHPYTVPDHLADCFAEDGSLEDFDPDEELENLHVEQSLNAIARAPTAAVREWLLSSAVECARRQRSSNDQWGQAAWFLRRAPRQRMRVVGINSQVSGLNQGAT